MQVRILLDWRTSLLHFFGLMALPGIRYRAILARLPCAYVPLLLLLRRRRRPRRRRVLGGLGLRDHVPPPLLPLDQRVDVARPLREVAVRRDREPGGLLLQNWGE